VGGFGRVRSDGTGGRDGESERELTGDVMYHWSRSVGLSSSAQDLSELNLLNARPFWK
jgi:hypothetical protein